MKPVWIQNTKIQNKIPGEIKSDKYYVALQRHKIFSTLTKDNKSDWTAHFSRSLMELSTDKEITFFVVWI